MDPRQVVKAGKTAFELSGSDNALGQFFPNAGNQREFRPRRRVQIDSQFNLFRLNRINVNERLGTTEKRPSRDTTRRRHEEQQGQHAFVVSRWQWQRGFSYRFGLAGCHDYDEL